ncbi:hypothetical protein [uncultured Metabacillus sp.]|uniref:hypothetical protein n=1 Tax=Metabacillus sp. Hm71 TaxID=3450743 RepID=UPI0026288CAA|nr:hypothetical protein [uncultured Metabacillus sp.]
MTDQNGNRSSIDGSVQEKMEDIWEKTCGTWENCNESTVQSFLAECEKHSIDPQFCMSWIQEHQNRIPNWQNVTDVTREWVVQHTSTGSPIQ